MNDLFHVSLDLRIDWSDMDLFGHVNNVAFFRYLQASRVHYWESIGLSGHFHQTQTGPILASSQCRFIRPLHYPGNITVQTRVDFMKNTSFGLVHRVCNSAGETAAEGQDLVVMYDFAQNAKRPIPGWLRQKIETLEGKTFPAA